LNERLRAKVAPLAPSNLYGEELGGAALREGDRVIQTRNDYEKEVFNGDMGRVVRVTQAGGITVAFPDRSIDYTLEQRGDLQLAFAITVHRAQGSEYEAVVMPLVMQHALMLQRNLLYTAVTRAKRLFVIVGSRRALELAVENAEQKERASRLAERVRERLPG
jgi:exodeoxyribonuclease V alpha subunit